jgi:hypothetical protein
MNQSEQIDEFSKVADIRFLLLTHPDGTMVRESCLHFLGDAAQAWYRKRFQTETHSQKQGFNMKHMSSYVTISDVSWKTVFNSNVADHYIWTSIDDAQAAARKSGYNYFTWNGRVYNIKGSELDITVDDLDFL